MSTRFGSMTVSESSMQTGALNINGPVSLLFHRTSANSLSGSQDTTVLKSVWDLLVSTEYLYSIFLKKSALSLWPIQNIPNRGKATRLTARVQDGFATSSCAI